MYKTTKHQVQKNHCGFDLRLHTVLASDVSLDPANFSNSQERFFWARSNAWQPDAFASLLFNRADVTRTLATIATPASILKPVRLTSFRAKHGNEDMKRLLCFDCSRVKPEKWHTQKKHRPCSLQSVSETRKRLSRSFRSMKSRQVIYTQCICGQRKPLITFMCNWTPMSKSSRSQPRHAWTQFFHQSNS